jgi:hypothetical protein
MNDEELRRKIFIKAAGEVVKVWPGHAAYVFNEPTNRTDQCLFCDLKFRLKVLVDTWRDCRLGKATMRDFELEVIGWKVSRIHTAEIFNIGKATDGAGMEVKKKKALEAARAASKFRR